MKSDKYYHLVETRNKLKGERRRFVNELVVVNFDYAKIHNFEQKQLRDTEIIKELKLIVHEINVELLNK